MEFQCIKPSIIPSVFLSENQVITFLRATYFSYKMKILTLSSCFSYSIACLFYSIPKNTMGLNYFEKLFRGNHFRWWQVLLWAEFRSEFWNYWRILLSSALVTKFWLEELKTNKKRSWFILRLRDQNWILMIFLF